MKIDVNNLPTDSESLRALLVMQIGIVDNLEFQIHNLDVQLKLYLGQKFGRKSDVVPNLNQRSLFNEVEEMVATVADSDNHCTSSDSSGVVDPSPPKLPRGKRQRIPESLPRVEIHYDLSDAEKICPNPDCHGATLNKIGTDVTEQLDIIPAKVQVLKHVRQKYGCACCQSHLVTAAMPIQPIPKSMASPSTIAHIATSKYADALPLYRQEVILNRIGLDLPRATTARWMMKAGALLAPILERIHQVILDGPIVNCDETPVQVLKEPGRKPWNKSYMWVMARSTPGMRAILFSYYSTRSQQAVKDLFSGYRGHIQSDAYSGYNWLNERDGVTRLGCWAHVRRKFVDVLKTSPKGGEGTIANEIVTLIKALYRIEKETVNAPPEIVVRIRTEKSIPILSEIKEISDKWTNAVSIKSPTGKALAYMNNEWSLLTGFVNCGHATIDNNIAERAIRPFAIGRKNWMFADTPSGAEASAALYSIIETAKANNIDPHAYLCAVFSKLPNAETAADVESLLPWNWRKSQAN